MLSYFLAESFNNQTHSKKSTVNSNLKFCESIVMGYDTDVDKELDAYLNMEFTQMKHVGMTMNCLITEDAAKTVEKQVLKTLDQGARIATGGRRHGTFYEPTILTDVTKDMDVMKDMEIFGPVLPVCGFDTLDEAVAIANQSCYGLSGCVFTKDWKKGMEMARRIQSGGVVVNGTGTYRNMMQPFGGYKMSGQGREGFLSLGEMVQEKVIVLKGFYH